LIHNDNHVSMFVKEIYIVLIVYNIYVNIFTWDHLFSL
jgi:hypothetical protein